MPCPARLARQSTAPDESSEEVTSAAAVPSTTPAGTSTFPPEPPTAASADEEQWSDEVHLRPFLPARHVRPRPRQAPPPRRARQPPLPQLPPAALRDVGSQDLPSMSSDEIQNWEAAAGFGDYWAGFTFWGPNTANAQLDRQDHRMPPAGVTVWVVRELNGYSVVRFSAPHALGKSTPAE